MFLTLYNEVFRLRQDTAVGDIYALCHDGNISYFSAYRSITTSSAREILCLPVCSR